jgi:23S rRNA pseudouridine1911/1915/1917 synthase
LRGSRPIPPGAPGHPREPKDRSDGPTSPRRGPRETEGEDARASHASERRAPVQRRAELLFEGEGILAFDKPEGLPVIAPEGSRARCLLDIATKQVRRRNPKGRAAIVHRIDRDTSGVVIFAEDGAMKRELMGSWDELVRERLYVALVEGEMPTERGTLSSFLKENKAGTVYVTEKEERGAKRAVTRWKVIGRGEGLSLLELSLETGRKHQIRVQLADAGHPVVGDPRYGRARDRIGRLCLHALAIELELPGRAPIRVETRVPPEFEAALRAPSYRNSPARGGIGSDRELSVPPSSSSASRNEARNGARPGRGVPRGRR